MPATFFPFLLGQMPVEPTPPTSVLTILPYLILAAVLGGMAIAFVWHVSLVALRNGAREKELQSQEKLRAIECGYPLAETSPMIAAISIGTGVPATALGAAFATTIVCGSGVPFLWPAAAMVGVAGAAFGTMLGLKAMELSSQTPQPIPHKPRVDPASFEMASHHAG